MAMRILNTMRRQYACYWPPNGVDDFGQPKYGDVVEFRVRWEDVQENFMNKVGETQLSKSKVYLMDKVDRNGVLWKGRRTELTDEVVPFTNDGATEISQVSTIPTLKADEELVLAYL